MALRYLRMQTSVIKDQKRCYKGVTLVVTAKPSGKLKVVAAYYGEAAPVEGGGLKLS
jgi:hypothetical protein